MARVDRLVVCAYLAVAIAPVAAMTLRVPDARIAGALKRPGRPLLSFADFRREQFQPRFTRWFESRAGLKGYAMHVDNSILRTRTARRLPPTWRRHVITAARGPDTRVAGVALVPITPPATARPMPTATPRDRGALTSCQRCRPRHGRA